MSCQLARTFTETVIVSPLGPHGGPGFSWVNFTSRPSTDDRRLVPPRTTGLFPVVEHKENLTYKRLAVGEMTGMTVDNRLAFYTHRWVKNGMLSQFWEY